MNKPLAKAAFGWGFMLWLFGYLLGFVFFFILPAPLIGWAILPLGILFTLWVLWQKVTIETFGAYLSLAVIWTAIAVIGDGLFIVKLLQPANGYYKFDVYLYYALTFTLPLIAFWWHQTHKVAVR